MDPGTLNFRSFLRCLFLVLVLLTLAARAQVTPSADSYTNTATPTTNYGAKTLLDVDGASQITYIQFNLASVPASASISQATLKLYVNGVTTAGSFNVDYVNGVWTESKIDSSNAPPLGANIASNISLTTSGKNQYILVDITSAVQAWQSGSEANNGIALVANGSFNATFDSKENTTTSHPPELDIAFAGGDGTITAVTTASGSGLTGGGTSGTLNLSLTTACANGQVLSWSGSAWACTNLKGGGTITGVTAGTDLTGGGTSGTVTLNLDTTKVPKLYTANIFNGNQTVNGNLNVMNASNPPFAATSTASSGAGAIITASGSGQTRGLITYSYGSSTYSAGMIGADLNSAGTPGSWTAGIWGATASPFGIGVLGNSYNGLSASAISLLNGGLGAGVWGDQPNDYGVIATSDNWPALFATSSNDDAIYAVSASGLGILAESSGVGFIYAGVSGVGSNTATGVAGYSDSGVGIAASNSASGPASDVNATLWALSFSDQPEYVLYAENQAGTKYVRTDNNGNLAATGTLYGAAKQFQIDHPLDPTGKYLFHTDIESPDMKNFYDGLAVLDANGEASVQLPDYFEALNQDFRYQLTSIGAPGPNLYIADEISGNRFRIAGGKPGARVSWQVTGIRHDAWANAHRTPVEVEKNDKEKGRYLHPDVFGAPAEKSVSYNGAAMQHRLEQMRSKHLSHNPRTGAKQ